MNALRLRSSDDGRTVALWLHGHATETQRAYLNDALQLLSHAKKPLAEITLGDLQNYADALDELSPATARRRLSVAKSLLTFAARAGLIPANPGAALRLPAVRGTLVERIMSEADVLRLISREDDERNHAICLVLYASGARNAEIAGLRARDVQAHGAGGVLSLWGKGGRPRVVRIKPATFGVLVRLLPEDADGLVFGCTDRTIRRVVKAAAVRAGLSEDVSPHWLRHAHASHALDRGCPIHLVQATLGHRSVETTGKYLHARPSDSSAFYLPV